MSNLKHFQLFCNGWTPSQVHFEFAAALHNFRLIRQNRCGQISAESADADQPCAELQENEEEGRRSVTVRRRI